MQILRLILLALLLYVLYKILWKGDWFPSLFAKKNNQGKTSAPQIYEEMKKDPFCGVYVPQNQAIKYKKGKDVFFFCSEDCKQKYIKNKKK